MSSPTRSCISREAMGSLRNPINTYGILGKSPSYLPGIDHIFPISFPFGGIWTCFLEGHVFFWGWYLQPSKDTPSEKKKTSTWGFEAWNLNSFPPSSGFLHVNLNKNPLNIFMKNTQKWNFQPRKKTWQVEVYTPLSSLAWRLLEKSTMNESMYLLLP